MPSESELFQMQRMWHHCQSHRCFSSSPHDANTAVKVASAEEPPAHGSGNAERIVLYRGRGMVPFRVLVRLKIFQLGGVAALAIPINTFLVEVKRQNAQH